MDANGHAQRCLPVAVQLVTAEVEIPAGYAVKLTHHAGLAVLVHGGLALLGGGELKGSAKHIDTGNAKAAVGAHAIADRGGLRVQRRLFHHVAGQRNAVCLAPVTAGVGKCLGKAVTNVIVIVVTGRGDRATGEIPKQLGQVVDQRVTVSRLEGVLQIVGPGQVHVLLAVRKAQRALAHKLRLVCKDGGHHRAKTISNGLLIALMRYLNELVNGSLVKRIHVGLVVIPRGVACNFAPYRPKRALNRVAVLYLAVGF